MSKLQRRGGEREKDLPVGAKLSISETRSFFWVSIQVQDPKDLGHALFFFQATSKELDGTWCPYGMPMLVGRKLAI